MADTFHRVAGAARHRQGGATDDSVVNRLALQQTAHDACSRRVHCVAKHYLDDPYVHHFARDNTLVNSPLMNRGSWLRAMAFENAVRRFYHSMVVPQHADPSTAPVIQVISFGSGVDTLCFRLMSKKSPLDASHPLRIASFVEIDLPELVDEKRTIIQRTPELLQLTAVNDVVGSYHLEAGDLENAAAIVSILQRTVQPNIPTIILAECVFAYLKSEAVDELLENVVAGFFNGNDMVALASYDAIEPNDRFGTMMAENLKERGIVMRGIRGCPSVASHVERCQRHGLKSCKGVSMKALYLTVPKTLQVKLNQLEMIDDWDEWDLVHNHYCFIFGWKGGDGTAASIPAIFVAE